MADPNQQAQAQAAPAAVEVNEFEALLQKEFKPKTDSAREAVAQAVRTLAASALEATQLVSEDAVKSIEAIIAEIDRKLTEQLNVIIHHNDFRALEGTWRGLHHLITNTETDAHLKIRVFNITKRELARNLKRYKGVAWDQSPIFKKLYEQEYGTPGGEPYGCLIGDYSFNHTPPDVELLASMSQIAASAHTPFLAAADPSVMNMETWQELGDPRDLTKFFQTAEYAPWRSLRDSEDSRYLGLCMPRFLGRLPYGGKTNPVDEFDFEEDVEGADHSKFVWCNAAFAMAVNINRAFKLFGWCSRIRGTESGGLVEGLPCYTFPTDDGGVDMKCPTEIAITDRREKELADNGFIPLSHYKNTDYAVFFGAQSVNKPTEYEDSDATANSRLSARLPYLFAACRFAHYLKCIVRDKVGSFKEREDMEKWLNNWIMQYVEPDPRNATEEAKARRPLAAAEVTVADVEGDPGYYTAKFFLRPHYQLEGLTASLRLVSKLPSAKGK
ncbi:MAG: type VI secretion system contractile sheath large subunit [Planctomycetes bacterium]|nr:type VI secretion system contractile sheath large subunit [Planctomycetota bacterium]